MSMNGMMNTRDPKNMRIMKRYASTIAIDLYFNFLSRKSMIASIAKATIYAIKIK